MSEQPKLGQLPDNTAARDAIHIAITPVTSAERLTPGQHVGLIPGTFDRVTTTTPHVGIVDPYLTSPVQPGQRFYLCLYPQTVTSLRHEWTHPAFGVVNLAVVAAAAPRPDFWRTPTVLSMCQQMRETRDYNALPILADALEDAGYDNADMLGKLRMVSRRNAKANEAARLACLIEGGEYAEAAEWLDDLAAEMDVTYNALMEAADDWVLHGNYTTQYGSQWWRDTLDSSRAPSFWQRYEIVTGRKPESETDTFFSCSC